MTIAEMMQLPVLAGREDAAQKLFAYNDLVMEMSGKINLTGIKAHYISYTTDTADDGRGVGLVCRRNINKQINKNTNLR